MNNDTTFSGSHYSDLDENEKLIADIKAWEDEDRSSAVLSPGLGDWLKLALSLNRQARILLKRAKELL